MFKLESLNFIPEATWGWKHAILLTWIYPINSKPKIAFKFQAQSARLASQAIQSDPNSGLWGSFNWSLSFVWGGFKKYTFIRKHWICLFCRSHTLLLSALKSSADGIMGRPLTLMIPPHRPGGGREWWPNTGDTCRALLVICGSINHGHLEPPSNSPCSPPAAAAAADGMQPIRRSGGLDRGGVWAFWNFEKPSLPPHSYPVIFLALLQGVIRRPNFFFFIPHFCNFQNFTTFNPYVLLYFRATFSFTFLWGSLKANLRLWK